MRAVINIKLKWRKSRGDVAQMVGLLRRSTGNHFDLSAATLDQDHELYERAREWSGPSDQGQERLKDFVAGAPDIDLLQRFCFQSSFQEYRNWGRLEEIVAMKAKTLSNIATELAYYADLSRKA